MNFGIPNFEATLRPYFWVGIFVLMFLLDYAWAKYNQATVSERPWAASFLALAIYWIGALGILSYSHDWTLIFPGGAGVFAGTFIATRRKKGCV
jgi:hypothetical protein